MKADLSVAWMERLRVVLSDCAMVDWWAAHLADKMVGLMAVLMASWKVDSMACKLAEKTAVHLADKMVVQMEN
jgi:hypothetical protein